MSKKSLIKRLTEERNKHFEKDEVEYVQIFNYAIDLIEQELADYPDEIKPTISKEMAEFVEYYGDDNLTICGYFDKWKKEYKKGLSGDTQCTLAQCYLFGYEIEQEPLYRMPVPYCDGRYYFLHEEWGIQITADDEMYGTHFTESGIQEYFPEISEFKELVEE